MIDCTAVAYHKHRCASAEIEHCVAAAKIWPATSATAVIETQGAIVCAHVNGTREIPEIAAAFGRGQGKPDLGYSYATEVSQIPNVTLINLDESLAETAANLAAHYRLRGSDAIYAAVAKRFATDLISLDREHLERLKKVVSVRRP